MITFSRLGQYGRLGNQFFQYAACKSIALEKGFDFKMPNLIDKIWHGQKSLLGEFNIDCEFYSNLELIHIEHNYNTFVEKTPYKYQEEIKNIKNNTNLFGHFQDKRYFINHLELFIKEFTPKEKYIKFAENKINEIKSKYGVDKVISIHIRRGDVIGGKFGKTYFNDSGDISNNSWFHFYLEKAIKFFGKKNIKYLVFTGGNRNNTNENEYVWCEKNFKDELFIINKENNPIIDFALMSRCDGNVLSPHSTFGYWAALMNQNEMVIAPKDYLIDNKYFNYNNFFPDHFKVI